jgi:DNA-binding LacI/PurR family transcriptional regulator
VNDESPGEELTPPVRRRVTTAEIARHAGVSRATVSYALNSAPGHPVSEATRQKVMDAARELGHLPYAPALRLRGAAERTVLLLTPSFAHGYVLGFYLDYVNRLLEAEGFVVLTTLLAEGPDASSQILGLWSHVNPAAAVAVGGQMTAEAREQIRRSHVVLADDGDAVDHSVVGAMQARHLFTRDVDAIAFAGPAESIYRFYVARSLAGVRSACAEAGVEPPTVHMIDGEVSSLDAAIDSWISAPEQRIGVCVQNDDLALRIIARMRMRGIEPGKDVLLIASDDIPAAALELTTVSIDWRRRAADLVREMIGALAGKERPAVTPTTYYQLIVRATA